MKSVLVIVFGFLCLVSEAQPSQPARFEYVQSNGDHAFTTVSMDHNGLALIRESRKMDGDYRPWELIVLDTALRQTWTTQVQLDPKLGLVGYEYAADEVYFLFRQTVSDYNDLYLVRVFLHSHAVQHLTITPKLDF